MKDCEVFVGEIGEIVKKHGNADPMALYIALLVVQNTTKNILKDDLVSEGRTPEEVDGKFKLADGIADMFTNVIIQLQKLSNNV